MTASMADQAETVARQASAIAELAAMVAELRAANATLTAANATLTATVTELTAANATLTARIDKLLSQLNRNSSNSSQPPSSDPPWSGQKRRPPSSPTGRKPGGQPGHSPHKRKMAPADEVFDVLSSVCPRCDAALDASTVVGEPVQVHQVVEIVAGSKVVSYQAREHLCRCGHKVRTRLRDTVPMTATGPKLQAIVTELIARYGMSRADAQQALAEIFDVKLSVGAIHDITERAAKATQPAVDDIASQLAAAPVKHCDETGWRHGSKRAWVWVVCSALGALFKIKPRRTRKAFLEVLPLLEGIVHTDRWRVYEIIDQKMRQLCHAHLRRDMQALIDLGPVTQAIGEALLASSNEMFHHWHRFVDGAVTRAELALAMDPIQQQWRTQAELAAAPPDRRAQALGKDLLRQWPSLWRFVDVDGVEPTNNRAERAIRPTVLVRKTNGGTASDLGAAFVGNLQSILATARCQGIKALAWLERALAAELLRARQPLLIARPSG